MSEPVPPSARRAGWARSPSVRVLAFVLLVKALVLAFGVISFEALTNRPAPGLLALWERWDARHYVWLAEHGYSSQGEERWLIAFLPLLPWLSRGVAALGLTHLQAAFVVATLASCAAAELLRRLARLDFSAAASERAVVCLFIFPTSYFLHIPYTEGLFLALSLGAFLSARRGRWVWAGIWGGLASLARVTGILLLPALALEAYAEWRDTGRPRAAWCSLGLVGLGFGGYLALNWAVRGDPLAFLAAHQEHWYRSNDWPWHGLWLLWVSRPAADATGYHVRIVAELFFALATLLATVGVARTQRLSYTFWMAAHWWIFTGQAFVYCVPRFSLVLFPLFLLLARVTRGTLAGALFGAWALLFLALFSSLFVQGHWAY